MANLTETSKIKGAFGQLIKGEVQEAYQTRSIVRAIAHEVQMNGNGEYVIVKVKDGGETIADYVAYGDNEFSQTEVETIKMYPDQQKFLGLDFDSVEYAMTNVNVREAKIRLEANKMQLAFDNHVLGLVRGAEDIQKQTATLSKTNIYSEINKAVRALDSKEVPSDGRVIMMNWATLSMLEQSPEFVGNHHVFTEANGLANIQVSGCQVLLSNLIQDGEIIVLHKDAIDYVALIEKEAVGTHEANFTDYFKALFVYGALISRPTSIVRIAVAKA